MKRRTQHICRNTEIVLELVQFIQRTDLLKTTVYVKRKHSLPLQTVQTLCSCLSLSSRGQTGKEILKVKRTNTILETGHRKTLKKIAS